MDCKFWRLPGLGLECIRVVGSMHVFPKHYHESYVIEVVEEGTNDLWCDGQTYSARPGDILLIHPNQMHTGYPAGLQAISYRSVYPNENLMKVLFLQITGRECAPRFRSNVIRDTSLAKRFKETHALLEFKQADAVARASMIVLLGELIARHADQEQSASKKLADSCPEVRMQRALQFLGEKFHENLSLFQLSTVCGLSEFHFVRTFKKFTGLAPYEYVIARRVEECRKLLKQGMPIADAAARTGFCDQSHLNRHFKRILGITPGKYATSRL